MKPEIKKLWVDALKSGEYKQGEGSLKNGDRYCCLGVLCDIHRKQKNNIYKWDTEGYPEKYLKSSDFLPTEVMKWAGIDYRDPLIKLKTEENENKSAATCNDEGYNFKTIANLIEKNL